MFESPEGVELIRKMRINKAFISAAGIDAKLGVTCANHYEVETKSCDEILRHQDFALRFFQIWKSQDCLFC